MESPRFSEPNLLPALTLLAVEAARAILAVRHAAAARVKPDGSPVTDADVAAEGIILAGLARLLPGVPVVAEESGASSDALGGAFLMVDPLDGTREFVAGRDEFTVNIALIVERQPVLGVLAAPALGLLWRGAQGVGAERLRFDADGAGAPSAVRTRAMPANAPVAFASRSHLDPDTVALLERMPGSVRHACGSALKFCRLAEGAGDLYPRLAPTSEWDVAAGHALLAAAGGSVLTPAGEPLSYGNAQGRFIVPAFIAWGDPAAAMTRSAHR